MWDEEEEEEEEGVWKQVRRTSAAANEAKESGEYPPLALYFP